MDSEQNAMMNSIRDLQSQFQDHSRSNMSRINDIEKRVRFSMASFKWTRLIVISFKDQRIELEIRLGFYGANDGLKKC